MPWRGRMLEGDALGPQEIGELAAIVVQDDQRPVLLPVQRPDELQRGDMASAHDAAGEGKADGGGLFAVRPVRTGHGARPRPRGRSEERRGGKEGGSTGKYRWAR